MAVINCVKNDHNNEQWVSLLISLGGIRCIQVKVVLRNMGMIINIIIFNWKISFSLFMFDRLFIIIRKSSCYLVH